MSTIFIGIAGGTGSGKTTLTRHLKEHFGDAVTVIGHDSYYKRQDGKTYEERSKVNYDHPDAFETSLLVEHLKALKAGRSIQCPVYSYVDHNRTDETVEVFPTKVIIVDHGSLTAQMGNHLKNAGVKPNTVYVAGFSLSPATAAAIENGYVQLVSEAQPYVMGYFGVVQTVLSKKYGFTGFSIDTGGGIVDAANIGAVSAFAKQGLR